MCCFVLVADWSLKDSRLAPGADLFHGLSSCSALSKSHQHSRPITMVGTDTNRSSGQRIILSTGVWNYRQHQWGAKRFLVACNPFFHTRFIRFALQFCLPVFLLSLGAAVLLALGLSFDSVSCTGLDYQAITSGCQAFSPLNPALSIFLHGPRWLWESLRPVPLQESRPNEF